MKTKERLCSKIALSIFSLLVLCRTAGAQNAIKGILSAADAGTCTANSTACSFLTIPSGSGGVTFTITSNASGNTVQFEATGDTEPTGSHTWVALSVFPSNSTTSVTSTASVGTWQANIAGFTQVRLRMSTFVGGTTTTYINLSTASARSNGGGGSVTHTAGNLTAFHIMIGNGAADATVDSACVTNGTGALSGCTSLSLGVGPPVSCGTATACEAFVEAAGAGTPTAGEDYRRADSATHNFVCSLNGAAESTAACGGISGMTTGFMQKAASGTTLANSLCDEAVTTANTITCTDTGGFVAPALAAVAAGVTKPACTGGSAAAWCANEGTAVTGASNVDAFYANSSNHCFSVVNQTTDVGCVVALGRSNVYGAFLQDFTAATMEIPEAAGFTATVDSTIGLDTTANKTHLWTNAGDSTAVVTQAAPAGIVIGSGADIAATSLCSTTNCPVGTYRVSIYIDLTTPCGTTGTFIPWLGYTDDSGARTGSSTTTFFDIQGTGSVPSTGTLTTTSTANFGQAVYILRTTGAATGGLGSINYGATRTACGTAGPMVGKMYLTVEPIGL